MILVLLLIAILPLKNHPLWTETGGQFTVAKIIGVVCVIYSLCYGMTRRRLPPYFETWQARWYLVFMTIVFISALTSGASLQGPFLTAISLFFFFLTIVSTVDTLSRLMWVLLTTVASLGWASLYVVRTWQQIRGWATGIRAEAWVVGDSNSFAVLAIVGIAISWYVRRELPHRWQRTLCAACVPLLIFTLLVGQSRGGFLGFSAAALYVTLRSQNRIRNATWLVLIVLAIGLVLPFSPIHRLLYPSVNDANSTESHQFTWRAGLAMVRTHPWSGVGIGTYREKMKSYAPVDYDGVPLMAHNAFLEIAAEMGFFALFVFCAVFASTFFSLERIRRQKNEVPSLVWAAAVGLQPALIGSLVAISSISGEYIQHVWLIVFVSACLPRLTTKPLELRPSHLLGPVDTVEQKWRPDGAALNSTSVVHSHRSGNIHRSVPSLGGVG